MSNLVIPISTGDIAKPSKEGPVRGGGSRLVPAVPIGKDGATVPCIWKSPYAIQIADENGGRTPAHECLLLMAKNPPTVMRAEVADSAWQHFGECLVEW